MASKQPRRSNLKSDLKFLAQTTYATMLIWAALTFCDHFDRRKKERKNQLTSTRPVGFAAGKKHHILTCSLCHREKDHPYLLIDLQILYIFNDLDLLLLFDIEYHDLWPPEIERSC